MNAHVHAYTLKGTDFTFKTYFQGIKQAQWFNKKKCIYKVFLTLILYEILFPRLSKKGFISHNCNFI